MGNVREVLVLCCLIVGLFGCGVDEQRTARSSTSVQRDLDAIVKDTLRVGVIEDALTWEHRTSGQAGLEWDLLSDLASTCHVPIVAVPFNTLDSLHLALRNGAVDVLAAQLSAQTLEQEGVSVTAPYAEVRPVVLLRRPMDGSRSASVRSVQVPWPSPFNDPLPLPAKRFAKLDCQRVQEPANRSLDRLITGGLDGILVTDLAAAQAMKQYPLLGAAYWSQERYPLVFAVRSNSPALLASIDHHLDDKRVRLRLRDELAELRFAERTGAHRSRSPDVKGGKASEFDALFKRIAAKHDLDWELLAAIAFRESGFDTTANSGAGAQGLMQLMPGTAERFATGDADGVEGHVEAAAVYLKKLDTLWQRTVPDALHRLRFVLASYNAGEGHIFDAQRLAGKWGLRTDRWENHVERALLLLSCPRHWRSDDVRNGYCRSKETFNFVRNVVATSAHFRTIPDEDPPVDTSAVVLPMDTLGFSGDPSDSLVVPPQEPADSLHAPAGEGG